MASKLPQSEIARRRQSLAEDLAALKVIPKKRKVKPSLGPSQLKVAKKQSKVGELKRGKKSRSAGLAGGVGRHKHSTVDEAVRRESVAVDKAVGGGGTIIGARTGSYICSDSRLISSCVNETMAFRFGGGR